MEKISPQEQQLIDDFIELVIGGLKKNFAPGNMRRDAHVKNVGLAKAEFIITDDIPDHCKIGLFKNPASYSTLIRFSRSNPKVQSDKKPDALGISVKLIDVPGSRFAEFNSEQRTQDFVCISYPAFPFASMQQFYEGTKAAVKYGMLGMAGYLLSRGAFKNLWEMACALKHHSSPLDVQYWSMTPYKLGDAFIKYTFIPTSQTKSKKPDPLTDSYLSENLGTHLENSDASFDFCVQFYKNDRQTPLDNNLKIWKEKDSPYIKLATLRIPKQIVGTQERLTLAENLSYSVAHSLTEHQPVGSINRARIQVYQAISKFRHSENKVPIHEPTKDDFEKLT